jgi:L-iditol 2-dehydrogenase
VKAIVKQEAGPGGLAWTDWPEPEARPGYAVVEIERAGICSTDVAIYDGTYRGREPLEIPCMLGHEAAGVVVAGGAGDVPDGTRVGLQVIWGRPHSRETLDGHENLDPRWIHIGASRLGGAFAERIAMPTERLIPLPETVSWEAGAMLEPLAVAANAMDLVDLRPGEHFVAIGPGPFSLLMILIARASGAAKIVAVGLEGVDTARLAIARRVGADATVEAGADPAETIAAVRDALGADGAEVVLDAGGTAASTPLALDLAAQGARVGIFGFTREAQIEPLRQIIRKGLTLHGVSAAARSHYGMALRMIERGTVSPTEIVSHTLPVARVAEGIELVKAREASKILLTQER